MLGWRLGRRFALWILALRIEVRSDDYKEGDAFLGQPPQLSRHGLALAVANPTDKYSVPAAAVHDESIGPWTTRPAGEFAGRPLRHCLRSRSGSCRGPHAPANTQKSLEERLRGLGGSDVVVGGDGSVAIYLRADVADANDHELALSVAGKCLDALADEHQLPDLQLVSVIYHHNDGRQDYLAGVHPGPLP